VAGQRGRPESTTEPTGVESCKDSGHHQVRSGECAVLRPGCTDGVCGWKRAFLSGIDRDNSLERQDALHVRGPYAKVAREYWLRRVLEAQQEARRLGPPEFQSLELISMAELQEIRRIWLYERHEFDDQLPQIYQQVMGQPFPKPDADDQLLRLEDWELLREVCGYEEPFFELQTGLLDIERQFRGMARRAGIYQALEERLKAGQFASEEEALNIRTEDERRRKDADQIQNPEPRDTAARQKTLFDG
jgi:hypothetical protein